MSEEKNHESHHWQETINVMGEDLLATLNDLFHDVTASRVIVRNKKGRTLVDIPVTIGAAGILLTLPYSLILVGAIWLTELELIVERKAMPTESAETQAEEPAAASEPAPDVEDIDIRILTEPTPDSAEALQQCQGLTKSGSQCKRNARPGSDYCAQHEPA
jgi:hypothetical protein